MKLLAATLLVATVLSACQWIDPPPTVEGAYKTGAYAGCMRAVGAMYGPRLSAQEIVAADVLCDRIASELAPEETPVGGPYFLPGAQT